MVAPSRNNATNTVLVVLTKRHRRSGFFVALIPDDLESEQVKAAFQDAGILPQDVCELENWQETSNGVCLAFVPIPAS